jgi:hypothetical protein
VEPNILYTHLTAGALFAYLLAHVQQWNKIPWITKDTAKMNAAIRLGLAALANLGIHWTWSGTWTAGRTLMIAIPSLSVLGHAAFNLAGQYATQHGWEKVFNIGGRIDPKVMNDVAETIAAKLVAARGTAGGA